MHPLCGGSELFQSPLQKLAAFATLFTDNPEKFLLIAPRKGLYTSLKQHLYFHINSWNIRLKTLRPRQRNNSAFIRATVILHTETTFLDATAVNNNIKKKISFVNKKII